MIFMQPVHDRSFEFRVLAQYAHRIPSIFASNEFLFSVNSFSTNVGEMCSPLLMKQIRCAFFRAFNDILYSPFNSHASLKYRKAKETNNSDGAEASDSMIERIKFANIPVSRRRDFLNSLNMSLDISK